MFNEIVQLLSITIPPTTIECLDIYSADLTVFSIIKRFTNETSFILFIVFLWPCRFHNLNPSLVIAAKFVRSGLLFNYNPLPTEKLFLRSYAINHGFMIPITHMQHE